MFEQLTEHIYVFPCDGYTDRPNIGLIVGSRYTLLYDAGNSGAHVKLMKHDLMEQGLPLPNAVVLSHWHWDHSFGASFWDVPVIASRETDQQLRRVQGWKWDDDSMDGRIRNGEDIRFCSEMIGREYPDRSGLWVQISPLMVPCRWILGAKWYVK